MFGRTDYAEPLAELGSLIAEGSSEAESASLDQFGDEWVELSLVPKSKVVWVFREAEGNGSGVDGD